MSEQRNFSHAQASYGAKAKQTSCVGCGAVIPAFGNRKRCVDCQEKAERERQKEKDLKRSAKRRLK